MDIRQNIVQLAIEAGGRLKVKSALNPILWLCAIVTVPGFVIMQVSSAIVSGFIQFIIFLPVIMAAIGFLYLLIFDRDKLQSEDYQIRKRSLQLVQEKGDDFPVIAKAIEVITNPSVKALQDQRGEDQ
jgi:hypothetical protein